MWRKPLEFIGKLVAGVLGLTTIGVSGFLFLGTVIVVLIIVPFLFLGAMVLIFGAPFVGIYAAALSLLTYPYEWAKGAFRQHLGLSALTASAVAFTLLWMKLYFFPKYVKWFFTFRLSNFIGAVAGGAWLWLLAITVFGQNINFDQMTGKPLRYIVERGDCFLFSHDAGFDPETGNERRLATKELFEQLKQQNKKECPSTLQGILNSTPDEQEMPKEIQTLAPSAITSPSEQVVSSLPQEMERIEETPPEPERPPLLEPSLPKEGDVIKVVDFQPPFEAHFTGLRNDASLSIQIRQMSWRWMHEEGIPSFQVSVCNAGDTDMTFPVRMRLWYTASSMDRTIYFPTKNPRLVAGACRSTTLRGDDSLEMLEPKGKIYVALYMLRLEPALKQQNNFWGYARTNQANPCQYKEYVQSEGDSFRRYVTSPDGTVIYSFTGGARYLEHNEFENIVYNQQGQRSETGQYWRSAIPGIYFVSTDSQYACEEIEEEFDKHVFDITELPQRDVIEEIDDKTVIPDYDEHAVVE